MPLLCLAAARHSRTTRLPQNRSLLQQRLLLLALEPGKRAAVRGSFVCGSSRVPTWWPKIGGGTSDPLAQLVLGTQTRETQVVPKTLNPEWNESFTLHFTPGGGQLMDVVL